MHRYHRAAVKVWAVLAAICSVMVVAGVLLLATKKGSPESIILLLCFGVVFGMIFLILWIVEWKCDLLIDEEKIVFPIDRSSKWAWKRKAIYFQDIRYISVETVGGAKFITSATQFYHFRLKNGDTMTEVLYPYGKQQEKEIRSELAKHIRITYAGH